MAGNRPPGGWGHWESDTPLEAQFHETTKDVLLREMSKYYRFLILSFINLIVFHCTYTSQRPM